MMHGPRTHPIRSGFLAALVALLGAASCGSPVDVTQAVEVTDVSTGWFDVGVVDGKNKLVPSVAFRLRNTSEHDLDSISLNVVFRFVDNGEDHEEIFKQNVPFDGKQTDLIVVRGQTGFTGEPPQTRADMLQNSFFRDMAAVIYVRQAASQWVELQRIPLERRLLTQ